MKNIVTAVNKLLDEEDVESYIHPHRPDDASKHAFYLVNDPKPMAKFVDIISKVDVIGLARIVVGAGIRTFESENPQLYPESEKAAAIADAKARLAALKKTAKE